MTAFCVHFINVKSLSYNFDHVFAFSAVALIPSLLSSFLIDMAQVTILENMDASLFVESLSRSSPLVTRHTSLIHIKQRKNANGIAIGGVEGMKHDWTHPTVRPWGEPLLAQCPKCFSLRAWEPVADSGSDDLWFRCKGANLHRSHCGHLLRVEKPPGQVDLTYGRSTWMSRPWPFPTEQEAMQN